MTLRGRVFPDFVWGKQSVWLSACRTPSPKGENRAAARTHSETTFLRNRR